ncbi:sigma 54-interacting transcriptional regulator [Flavobacterium gawalongense]|uniref:Magnesium chelatase n=1 Tax=Flavobacterium gawalongense TaxID=2594432 RepID=A0A553BPI9_9FLAO|nr:sigma 54-interacting transcriptional regulator [Flavobacterium gawalongense]TRX01571.1 magnesium chelatase [Flavobacterium gawalongense]TRX06078.1 magnesium chelatase [Flavobacterium gawalongense]TRX10167.1 magnesium chelatase [Flavobacterium gawalongense]TRX11180.1 magnesium chelatase [Flavobacterium gawalongense]TRX28829.1 magnesium chelatase [Flavobacterium gawalongense]
MKIENIKTLGELKKSGYESKSIKDELRSNLREKIKSGKSTFEGVHGFENTVIPELERAILSRHNINLLGLRGQAKTRLARKMIELLDEYIPFVSGSEINDDPLQPISRYAKDVIAAKGDETPISWLHRSDRFFEKLATPDVTVADLIGDVDPIKAANLKLSYADDRVIHFGMIPRANRSIFVINELPDLQARIQVALFNILQEGDIQIRGFKLRMPLDMQFVFTANPEDYTNRGSIVTPLKDRIGSQILTHYPETIKIARTITEQEAKLDPAQSDMVYVPSLARDLLEQISFEARESEYIDNKSGVSARLSITALENLLSTAERRALKSGEDKTTLRLSDFMGIIPAITGKVELVYEGEQEGAAVVAQYLLGDAIHTFFPAYFPKIEKLQKQDEKTPYTDIVEWFFAESGFELLDDCSDEEYERILGSIVPLEVLIKKYQPQLEKEDKFFMKEFILWGLVEYKKLSKDRFSEGYQFKDIYGSFISKL